MEIQMYFKNMTDVLLKPKATIKKNKNIDLGQGLMYYLIASFIAGIGIALMTLGTGLAAIIAYPISAVIGLVIGGAIVWFIAKLLGCKTEIGNFIGQMGFTFAPVNLLSWIPIIGQLVGLYGIYLFYIMLTEASGMNSGKAILVILIPILLLVILGLLFAALLVSVLAGLGLGAIATQFPMM